MDEKTTDKAQKERHVILAFYVVFFTSIFISFIPINIASLFAIMICVCTLATIYSMRVNSEEDGITENHMTYLIRTFWRANLYMLIAGLFGILYLAIAVDYIALKPCLTYITDHGTYIIRNGTFDIVFKIMKPCSDVFFQKNQHNLVIAAFIAFFPTFLYLLFRCIKGGLLIMNNEHVPTNKL